MKNITALVPMVVEREGNSERSYDLYSRMLRDRIVFLTGEVETHMAQMICAQLLFLDAQDSETPINMYVNSPGGGINAGLAIFDCMQFTKAPVYTTCMGMCASMGSFLAMAGEPGHRYALPNAEILIHQPLSSGGGGQCTDIQIQARHIQKLKLKLTTEYAKRCNGKKTYEDFSDVMERDFILDPEAALEWGLIDAIIQNRAEIPA